MQISEQAEILLAHAADVCGDPIEGIAAFALCMAALCKDHAEAKEVLALAYQDMQVLRALN